MEKTYSRYNEVREQAEAKMEEAGELAQRMLEVQGEIVDLEEKIRAARIAAARAGENPSEAIAALQVELDGVVSERDDLPEHHFAARLRSLELGIQAEGRLMAEAVEGIARAQEEIEPLRQALEKAQARFDEKDRELNEWYGIHQAASERQARAISEIEGVELEGPRPLPENEND